MYINFNWAHTRTYIYVYANSQLLDNYDKFWPLSVVIRFATLSSSTTIFITIYYRWSSSSRRFVNRAFADLALAAIVELRVTIGLIVNTLDTVENER